MRVATRSPLRILYVGSLIAGVAFTTFWAGAGCINPNAGSGANQSSGAGAGGTGGAIDCSNCPTDSPTSEGFAAPAQNQPPANASSSTGMGTPVNCPMEPQGPNVAKAPDDTRTYDSAVYAHSLLAHGILPDPSTIRLADFVNYDAYSSSFDPAGPAKNASLELTYDIATGQGEVIGRLVTPPKITTPTPLGMVIVLDTAASVSPVRDLELAAAQALVGKLSTANGDTAIVRTWDSGSLGALDSAAQVLADARNGKTPLPIDKSNNVIAMLEAAGNDAKHLGAGTKHVVVFTDGGGSPTNLDPVLAGFEKYHFVLDVVAVSSEASLEKAPYNSILLDALTARGGTRMLLTDNLATGTTTAAPVYRDVNELLGDRFDETFRDAYLANRVVLTLPSTLRPVGVELQSNAGLSSTTTAAKSAAVRGVSAGYGRGIEFRQLVEATPNTDISVGTCTFDHEIDADFTFSAEGVNEEVPLQLIIGPNNVPTPAEHYDAALLAYVSALRAPTASAFHSAATMATPTIQSTVNSFCGAANGADSLDAKSCARLNRMLADLKLQPHP